MHTAPAHEKRRHFPSGFTHAQIAPGQVAEVEVKPQVLFRGERLAVAPSNARSFNIVDIKVGKDSQLAATGEMPAEAFSALAPHSGPRPPHRSFATAPRRDVTRFRSSRVLAPADRPDYCALCRGKQDHHRPEVEEDTLVADVVALIEASRAAAARSVNAVMTATYWRVGQVIVEREQQGAQRAEYGSAVLERLADTLTVRYGRGFSRRNLDDMKRFYLAWPIRRTASAKSDARRRQRDARRSLRSSRATTTAPRVVPLRRTAIRESPPQLTSPVQNSIIRTGSRITYSFVPK